QIDTSDPAAMESAMRIYNGKPLVNSVNGKRECMRAVFPLVKKYGGAVIALTLDEDGIPADADGRIKIAKRILETAKEYGIDKKDIIFDTLAMSISADGGAAVACLKSLEYIKRVLGANTSLGVSNISFGLPQRDFINSAFFAMALQAGLSAAIMNPFSEEMTKAYMCFMALSGRDKNCLSYIDYASGIQSIEVQKTEQKRDTEKDGDLKYCIVKGLKSEAAEKAKRLLETLQPLEVIDGYIIPALDETGADFENKKVYLPQLLMSAEAASAAFEAIKASFRGEAKSKKLKVVLATVKGDVHDIGKNIVKTLLENYGFNVIDLGRDVPPEKVVEAVKEGGARLCGLSALMTTTVPNMKTTIDLLRGSCPDCKIIVGGAVLTPEYAQSMGADGYGKDAMATVRFAEELERSL
ncbi:MAG: cobalamin-dependent protein, partial [Clostridia bacterium]|nr:cobalamin-dependent protein [Clostridia bacterium]